MALCHYEGNTYYATAYVCHNFSASWLFPRKSERTTGGRKLHHCFFSWNDIGEISDREQEREREVEEKREKKLGTLLPQVETFSYRGGDLSAPSQNISLHAPAADSNPNSFFFLVVFSQFRSFDRWEENNERVQLWEIGDRGNNCFVVDSQLHERVQFMFNSGVYSED